MEQKKVGFVHSIRSRIILLVAVTIVINAVLVWVMIQPKISKSFSATQESYMEDMAISYGKMLGNYVDEGGL